ncbi:hypothetical protein [Specibacter sp. NPDC078709]|uniref:hypothetical protein n=1 Tax=Specibacter sp. NPDC078709 TaxID=3154364 RepID=UPI0034314E9E
MSAAEWPSTTGPSAVWAAAGASSTRTPTAGTEVAASTPAAAYVTRETFARVGEITIAVRGSGLVVVP